MASLIKQQMKCDVMWDPAHEWYETAEQERARLEWKPCKKSRLTGRPKHNWDFENPDPRPRKLRKDGKPMLRIARMKCTKCGQIKEASE